MDVFRLTRQLVDIESITGNEAAVGEFLAEVLSASGYRIELMPVEGRRVNVYATPSEEHEVCEIPLRAVGHADNCGVIIMFEKGLEALCRKETASNRP